eukprot:5341648-Prymnesium_polylepis.2
MKLQKQLYSFADDAVRFDDLKYVADLGSGAFGTVLMMRNERDGSPVALKVMRISRIVTDKHRRNVLGEKAVLSQLRHPFIVRLLATFKDEARVMMAMEFVSGGEVYTWLATRFDEGFALAEDEVRFIGASVAMVLDHIHSHLHIYRDLKPDNLMVSRDGFLKLVDFGYCKRLARPQRTFTCCGTPEYMAPEMLLLSGHAQEADWWALGVLLFECLHSYTPFTQQGTLEPDMDIIRGTLQALVQMEIPPNWISTICHVIVKCLQPHQWAAAQRRQLAVQLEADTPSPFLCRF